MSPVVEEKPWFKRWAERAASKGRSRMINDRLNQEPYLERFYVMPRFLTLWIARVVVHKFWASDAPEDGLHDHPWPYMTIILEGGYIEHTPEGQKLRLPGDVVIGWPRSLHRVELLDEGKPTWTLFFMGPRIRTWGFRIDKATGGHIWYDWRIWIAKRYDEIGKHDEARRLMRLQRNWRSWFTK